MTERSNRSFFSRQNFVGFSAYLHRSVRSEESSSLSVETSVSNYRAIRNDRNKLDSYEFRSMFSVPFIEETHIVTKNPQVKFIRISRPSKANLNEIESVALNCGPTLSRYLCARASLAVFIVNSCWATTERTSTSIRLNLDRSRSGSRERERESASRSWSYSSKQHHDPREEHNQGKARRHWFTHLIALSHWTSCPMSNQPYHPSKPISMNRSEPYLVIEFIRTVEDQTEFTERFRQVFDGFCLACSGRTWRCSSKIELDCARQR